MANRNSSKRIEDAGVLRHVKFCNGGIDYDVFETRPKRNQDVYRFEVRKDGESDAYVVSFQDSHGRSGQCSCKGWIFRRQDCKHIRMCRAEFMTASAPAPRREAAPAPRALPPKAAPQLALPGMDEVAELEKQLTNLRATYRAKKVESDALLVELGRLAEEGNMIKAKIERLRGRAA